MTGRDSQRSGQFPICNVIIKVIFREEKEKMGRREERKEKEKRGERREGERKEGIKKEKRRKKE